MAAISLIYYEKVIWLLFSFQKYHLLFIYNKIVIFGKNKRG